MEILNLATDWATAEATASAFFIVFGVLFIIASIGFWRLGKTKMARAYRFPMLIAGLLLILLGGALFDMYYSAIDGLTNKYNNDPNTFVEKEIARTTSAIEQYKMDLYGVFPIILMVASLLTIIIKRNIWRAIFITLIAISTIILLVDSHAISLLEGYHADLKQHQVDTKVLEE